MGEVCGAHEGMVSSLRRMEEKLDKLVEAVLVGNGTPSLKQRLHDLELCAKLEEQRRLEEAERTRRESDKRENRLLVAVRIIGPYLSSLLTGALVYAVKDMK